MTDESIFAAAIAIPSPDQRAAYLARACAGNPALRREVEELIGAHAANNPLDRPVRDVSATGAFAPADDEAAAVVGDRIGPYKLLERIGEGGMGEVWVADQLEPMKRRVALKLIKPGMDSRSVLGRFEAERQALAVMDHPNIAKVLDAGTTPDGRPYFVMELVKGTPITEFCDARKLTPNQRLELFIPVCQAIQHAHMKGIIHRDIKPSNVLVALHDETPVPKVIDFGVSKAIGHQLTEKTIYTGFGALIGTPAYMAPEQATFNQLDVDTRADVYALGVMLYELLTGSPPIEQDRLKKAALDELLRIVRDEEPQRPSQRLSTSQAKATIAATRQSDPAKLSQLMRGELDWIVMKALEKDRSRRYDTANGLAKDIQRYLSGDSVEACPPTLAYRLRKAYRKNRAAVLTSAAFAAMLLVATSVSIAFALHAREQRREADAERDEKEQARLAEAGQRNLAEAAQQKAQQERDAAKAARDELRRSHYAASMNLINTAWEADNVRRVMELLEENRPKPGEADIRGFEWDYWDRLCHAERRLWKFNEWAGVGGSLLFSGDGRRIVRWRAVSEGQKMKEVIVCVWDVAGETELCSLKLPLAGPPLYSFYLAINRDGSRIAYRVDQGTSGNGGQERVKIPAIVYDVASRLPVFSTEPLSSGDLALSPDGRRLTAVQNIEIASDPPGSGRPRSRRWENIKIWDLAKPDMAPVVIANDAEEYTAVSPSFSPEGSRLVAIIRGVASSASSTIRIWDTATGKSRLSQTFKQDSLMNVAFSPDGSRLATVTESRPGPGSFNLYLSVWDGAAGDQLTPLKSVLAKQSNTDSTTNRIAFSPDGKRVAMSSPTWASVVFDIASGEIVQRIKTSTHITSLAYSADGTRLITAGNGARGTGGNVLQEWDVAPYAKEKTATAPPGLLTIVSPNGERKASYIARMPGRDPPGATAPTDITIRDHGGKVMHVFTKHTKPVNRALFSPDGRWVFSASEDGEAMFWEADTGEVRWKYRRPGNPTGGPGAAGAGRLTPAGHFSHDGRWLVLPDAEGMKLVSVPDLKERCKLGTVSNVYFSRDNRRLATLYRVPPNRGVGQNPLRSTVKLWDPETGRELKTLTATGALSSAVTFSPDSRLIALSGAVHVVICDAVTGDELSVIQSGTLRANSIIFSPDGSRLSFPSNGFGGGLSDPFGEGLSEGQFTAVWDAVTGMPIFRLEGHSGAIQSVAFSPDGKRIATAANSDQNRKFEVKIWDAVTGKELLTLTGPNEHKSPIAPAPIFFSPNGHRLTLRPDIVQGQGVRRVELPSDLIWDATPRPEAAK